MELTELAQLDNKPLRDTWYLLSIPGVTDTITRLLCEPWVFEPWASSIQCTALPIEPSLQFSKRLVLKSFHGLLRT